MASPILTYETTYETHSGDEQTGEFRVRLSFRIVPAEPDVGIMSDGIEPVGVEVLDAMAPEQRFIDDFATSILEDDRFWDRIEPELHREAYEHKCDEADARAEAKWERDYE